MTNLEKMKLALREERIKHGCDYAIAFKYGEAHVLCHEVYADYIREAAREHEVKITSLHTWGARGRDGR